MRGVNKVILVGTLGRDPEVRYAANGNAIANLSLATSEQWTDRATGEKQERTEWHRVVIFGKVAEVAGQYLKKGSQVYIEKKLQTRKWQDQATQQDKDATEVVVDISGTMQMVGSKNAGDASPNPDPRGEQLTAVAGGVTYPAVANNSSAPKPNTGVMSDFDDMDVPF